MSHHHRVALVAKCVSVFVFLLVCINARATEVIGQQVEAATAIKERYESELLALPGVTAVGVGLCPSGACIQVYVTPEADKDALPVELEGVPVQITETGGFRTQQEPLPEPEPQPEPEPILNRLRFERPVPMGVSTGNPNVSGGTLGLRVKRVGSDQVGYITNNHVAASNAIPDTAFFCQSQITTFDIGLGFKAGFVPTFRLPQCQPGLADAGVCDASSNADKIGELVQVIPGVSGGEFENAVDAAFVESNRGCISKQILGLGAPQARASSPQLGVLVRKSGRTTGVTDGAITAINVSVVVADVCGFPFKYVNQAVVSGVNGVPFSAGGDSGAAVLDGKNRPVGLLFAGDGTVSIVTPMPTVLKSLAVEIDTADDAPPSATCP